MEILQASTGRLVELAEQLWVLLVYHEVSQERGDGVTVLKQSFEEVPSRTVARC